MGVCDLRDKTIATMAQYDVSPLDLYACLSFCVERGLASKDDGLARCVVTVKDLGEALSADAFEQHTAVALRVAPAPVHSLHLFEGATQYANQIAADIDIFISSNGYHAPCSGNWVYGTRTVSESQAPSRENSSVAVRSTPPSTSSGVWQSMLPSATTRARRRA